jgi:hypothetical protein
VDTRKKWKKIMSWICRYCGKDTKWIDMDYLVGTDHLQCALENDNKVKTKLKISNPEKINTKNLCLDKSIVEINYVGLNASVNTDNETYTLYKFVGIMNSNWCNTIFEIHTDIKDNTVQFNIWKNGGVELNRLPVNVIRDRDELINRMIAEVKKS